MLNPNLFLEHTLSAPKAPLIQKLDPLLTHSSSHVSLLVQLVDVRFSFLIGSLVLLEDCSKCGYTKNLYM
jgi:hypothetical protein